VQIAAPVNPVVLDAIFGNQDYFLQVDSQRMNGFMKSAFNKSQRFTIALGVSAIVIVSGCSGDESGLGRRYNVTGKVTYKDAPVPHGTITFVPTKPPAPEGRAATGQIKDGDYSLSTTGNQDGALPGDYNIAIVAMDIDLASAVSPGAQGGMIHQGDAAHLKAIKNAKKLIPDKYGLSETSELKATVGTSGNKFDFDLKD
jgi:hypothetical protein